MPSWSRPCSSVRSSCFVFVSSRIAVKISAEPTIQDSPNCVRLTLPVERESRFAHVGQRDSLLDALRVAYDGDLAALLALHPHDLDLRPPAGKGLTLHRRPASHVSPPLARV